MVHNFTCAGVLPTQYIKLSKFMGMGRLGHGYMKKGMNETVISCNYSGTMLQCTMAVAT